MSFGDYCVGVIVINQGCYKVLKVLNGFFFFTYYIYFLLFNKTLLFETQIFKNEIDKENIFKIFKEKKGAKTFIPDVCS